MKRVVQSRAAMTFRYCQKVAIGPPSVNFEFREEAAVAVPATVTDGRRKR
tara:strand:+ start:12077 stop:12226 length:150 start_codon:yes stop_codon:yes gene_type:complete